MHATAQRGRAPDAGARSPGPSRTGAARGTGRTVAPGASPGLARPASVARRAGGTGDSPRQPFRHHCRADAAGVRAARGGADDRDDARSRAGGSSLGRRQHRRHRLHPRSAPRACAVSPARHLPSQRGDRQRRAVRRDAASPQSEAPVCGTSAQPAAAVGRRELPRLPIRRPRGAASAGAAPAHTERGQSVVPGDSRRLPHCPRLAPTGRPGSHPASRPGDARAADPGEPPRSRRDAGRGPGTARGGRTGGRERRRPRVRRTSRSRGARSRARAGGGCVRAPRTRATVPARQRYRGMAGRRGRCSLRIRACPLPARPLLPNSCRPPPPPPSAGRRASGSGLRGQGCRCCRRARSALRARS